MKPSIQARQVVDRLAGFLRRHPLRILAVVLGLIIMIQAWPLLRDGLDFAQQEAAQEPVAPQAPAEGAGENLGESLEEKARRLDWAIIQAMRAEGLGQERVRLVETLPVQSARGRFVRQTLNVDAPDPDRFLAALGREADQLNQAAPRPEIGLGPVGANAWGLAVLGETTHVLLFSQTPTEEPLPVEPEEGPEPSELSRPPRRPGQGGEVAVVIDDLGADFQAARQLVELNAPITFSVLPFLAHTAQTAQLGASHGRDVLLHLPMEPRDYPRQNPGPGALFARMSSEEVLSGLRRDLAQIPHVKGVNNHMGSRFTESAPGMAVVLAELRERGLFFLDSGTSQASVGPREARKLGQPCYKRDVFLDNVRQVPAILAQLRLLERVAGRKGYAVAIGHPHRETIEALRLWLKEKRPDIRVVPLSSLPR